MNIKVNGEVKSFDEVLTISQLLVVENVEMPDMVSVQLNGEILLREQFDEIKLNDNDEVEFLYFMGGGSIGF